MKGQTPESDPDELAPERRLSFLVAQCIGRERRFSGHHQAAAKFSKLEIITFISY